MFAFPRQRDHRRPATLAELDRRGADTAGCACDQNLVARRNPRAAHHILTGCIGAGERGQFHIGEGTLNPMGKVRYNFRVLRKASVTLAAEIPGLGRIVRIIRVAQPAVDDNPLADATFRNTGPDRHDLSADIGTLNARKRQRRAGPSRRLSFGVGKARLPAIRRDPGLNVFVVPGRAGIDIRVIERGRAHADQNLAVAWNRHRPILVKFQLIQPAMAGQDDCFHGSWDTAHNSVLPLENVTPDLIWGPGRHASDLAFGPGFQPSPE